MKAKLRKRQGGQPGRQQSRPGPRPPSPSELRMLRLVAKSIDQTGTQPSYREIARMLGYEVWGYVYNMVKSLERKGVIQHTSKVSKSISFDWRNYL